jgi:cytochrome P450
VAAFGADLTLEDLGSDPHPALARLRLAAPVAWIPALGAWLVTSRNLAVEVMRDDVTFTVDDPRFSTGRVVGPSMLTRDGAEHPRHRDPFVPPFRLAEIRERFAPLVEVETDALIDGFQEAGRAELRRSLAGPLAARVVAVLLGLETAETGTMLGWYDAIVDSVTGVAAGREPTEAGHEAFDSLSATVEPSLPAMGDLTPVEAVSNVAVLMFGGIETTEGMIANLVFHLLSNPDQLTLVRAEPALLANAVEESLRLEPAAAVVDRYATRDIELAGAQIAGGDLVEISLAGANRDPAVFPEPDRFDVLRQNAKLHVAFAYGPHVCIGMHLARLEAHTAVRRLLERLPELRLDRERPTAPRGLVFRKPPRLDVVWS